jgi:threonine dehydratase
MAKTDYLERILNARVYDVAIETPLEPAPNLSKRTHNRILLKREDMQPVFSFKLRGAYNKMANLKPDALARGVIAASAGNHAQGVAWAAKKLGISATIVMPSNAPRMKLEATKALGAQVVLYDRATESREAVAAALIAKNNATLVHAFGDPWVIEGQGTAGIEIAEQLQSLGIAGPDLLVSCCGGGGLAAGLALACPDAEIAIVEPEGWDDIIRSLEAGEILPVKDLLHPTYCDALQTPQTYPINFEVLRKLLELVVGLFAAIHLQEALSVRHHSVHVSLVLHCDFQSSIPLVQFYIHFNSAVE